MGCTGVRSPEMRYTSHPFYVEAIIECLQDCGARVIFGDDVSRAARYIQGLWASTGMLDVANRTGAKLVDFVSCGGREVRGRLSYPRTHFVSNWVFEADAVVNAANCRSLSDVVMSGAIKNMFGTVLGTRKGQLHGMFPDIGDFSQVLVDIFQVTRTVVSFLDLTSVIEGQGIQPAVQNVGLILGSTDPIALDTVATYAIGYEDLTLWTNVHGQKAGLGCNDINQIWIRGVDWATFPKKRLRHPAPPRVGRGSLYDQLTRFVNHTVLRPRPVINGQKCTGCGDCIQRCPTSAISSSEANVPQIDLAQCAECGCCIKICEAEAVELEFIGLGKTVRKVIRTLK